MFSFGERRPVLFEIILTAAAFAAAILFTVAGNIFYLSSDLSSSLGRIVIGLALLMIYRRAFKGGKPHNNMLIVIPALLFAAWNLYYNLGAGNKPGGTAVFIEAAITALAPAVFEEVLFRGIFIHNLEKSGRTAAACLFIPALFFSVVHITNLAGLDAASVVIQLVYSFAVGLVLAAVYLRNRRIMQVIVIHFLIDFTNRIYIGETASSTTAQIVMFAVLLLLESAYAIALTASDRDRLSS